MSTCSIPSILSKKRKEHSESSSDSSKRVSFGENQVVIIEEDTSFPVPDQYAFLPEKESNRMETYLEISNNMSHEIKRTLPILCKSLDNSQGGDDAINTFNNVLAARKLVCETDRLLSLGSDGLPMDKDKIERMQEYRLTVVLNSTCPPTPISEKNAKCFPSEIKILTKGIEFLETVNKFANSPVNSKALKTFTNNAIEYMGLE